MMDSCKGINAQQISGNKKADQNNGLLCLATKGNTHSQPGGSRENGTNELAIQYSVGKIVALPYPPIITDSQTPRRPHRGDGIIELATLILLSLDFVNTP
jgi:hypothetical protein